MRFRLIGLLLGASVAVAGFASGQTLSVTPQNPKRWDASVTAGSFSARRSDLDQWDRWADTGVVSAELGRYWSKHLKTAISVGRSGEGSTYVQEQLPGAGQFPIYRYSQHYLQVTHVSGAVSYQFLENAWVHPVLTAGVRALWERDRIVVPPQPAPIPTPAARHAVTARPFGSVGAKFYASPTVFLRADLQISVGVDDGAHVMATGGVGFDF